MQMIRRDDVAKIAHLARLKLTDEELDTFSRQIEEILEHVAKLGELDLEGVEPFVNAAAEGNVFRRDEPHAPLPRAEGLANAPRQADGFFKVPAVQG